MAEKDKPARRSNTDGSLGGVYLLAVIGAAVYFIGNADGFWAGVLGLLKAIVWPAFAVYRAFELMNL